MPVAKGFRRLRRVVLSFGAGATVWLSASVDPCLAAEGFGANKTRSARDVVVSVGNAKGDILVEEFLYRIAALKAFRQEMEGVLEQAQAESNLREIG